MGSVHPKGVDGMIARAGIALRCAIRPTWIFPTGRAFRWHNGVLPHRHSRSFGYGYEEDLELQKVPIRFRHQGAFHTFALRDLLNSKKSSTLRRRFAERRAIVASPLPRNVEARRHSEHRTTHRAASLRPIRWRTHRHTDGLSLEVLCNAIGARTFRRHELTLTLCDGVNRPPAGLAAPDYR